MTITEAADVSDILYWDRWDCFAGSAARAERSEIRTTGYAIIAGRSGRYDA